MWTKIKTEFEQGKNLLGFVLLQTLGQAVSMAIPLVIAKLFSKNMFGQYSLSEMIIFFFAAVLILSAKTPFIVYANQERAQTGAIRKSFSVQCVIISTGLTVFVAAILIFGSYLMVFAGLNRSELFFVIFAVVGIAIKDFTGNLFMALNERTKSALAELGFGIAAILFLVVFNFYNLISLKTVFLTYFLAAFLVLIVSAGFVNRSLFVPLVFDKRHSAQMLSFTGWLVFGAFATYFVNWAGPIILRWFEVSFAQIGTYNLAYKFFKGLLVLSYIVPAYFLPHISEHAANPDKLNAYLYVKRPRVLLLGAICLVIAWIAIPYVLRFFYGDKFDDAVAIARILFLGNAFVLYIAMYGPLLNALKIYKFLQAANITQVIINIVLSLLLIPRYGLTGAAIATVLSYLYLAIAIECYYRLRLKKLLIQT
jgi:O-antigen/teichoic acid export membrane protein